MLGRRVLEGAAFGDEKDCSVLMVDRCVQVLDKLTDLLSWSYREGEQ
jgi:hypothetical protein